MKKKWLYSVFILLCISLLALSNNYNKSGKPKPSPAEDRSFSQRQESAVTEEILETWPLHHLLLTLAEW